MIVDRRAVSAGRWLVMGSGVSTDSARLFRGRLVAIGPAGVVEDGAGAVPGGGDEV
jgi:hypothetical protein